MARLMDFHRQQRRRKICCVFIVWRMKKVCHFLRDTQQISLYLL
jgi:hypothetical protein